MPHTVIERSNPSYEANSKRFLLHGCPKDYSNQFSHLYNQRLVRMRNILRLNLTIVINMFSTNDINFNFNYNYNYNYNC